VKEGNVIEEIKEVEKADRPDSVSFFF